MWPRLLTALLMSALRIDILTLFPEMFPAVLGTSILGRAAQSAAVDCHVHNIRDWSSDKHRRVDDRPFGGGPGMVLMCQPLYDAVIAVEAMDARRATRILLSPQGRLLDQAVVEDLATHERLLMIAGHYEGIDERLIDELQPLEISVGDYVLSGGELPAMILCDAIARLLPGVLGDSNSAAEDSFGIHAAQDAALRRGHRSRFGDVRGADAEGDAAASFQRRTTAGVATDPGPEGQRLLDCPHFTRPQVWRGREVPEVLISGDHAAVAAWRRESRLQRTRQRRPDLLHPTAPQAGT
jgi:tRNA (guanine37-N1)-methyltransferase